jgi:hypothetical protein
MCNSTTPSVNLQTAVLMQVQEFVNAGQSFSRYDITKALRQKCSDGTLEIPELEIVNPGASYRYDIRKQAVDDVFEQLWRNCLANGLPPLQVTYDRNLGYRIFSVDQNALAQSAVPAILATATAPTPAYVSTPPTAVVTLPPVNPNQITSVPASSLVPLTDAEIKRRVTLYMDHCQSVGVTPSLKQIQSAIKRGNKSTGLSYREIANVAMSLGYKV